MGALSPTHWLIIVGVLVVLFGAKRLPDAARSLGRSARILKAEVKDMGDDHGPSSGTEGPTTPPAAPAAVEPITEQVGPTSLTSSVDLADGRHKQ